LSNQPFIRKALGGDRQPFFAAPQTGDDSGSQASQ
jgi:hypothetical protein